MNIKKTCDKFLLWNYPLFMVTSLLFAVFLQTTNDRLVPLFLVYWMIYGLVSFSICPKSNFKTIMTLFVVYVFLSFVQYLSNGIPFRAYYFDFRGVLVPMFFVFVGLTNSDSRVYKWFVISTVFLVGVGIVLYFLQPGWYLSFRVNVTTDAWFMEGSNVSESNVMANVLTSRFASFMGNAYPIAYYSIFSLCILMDDVYKDHKHRIFKSTAAQMSMIGVLIIGVVLTLTRVALLFMVCLLIYYLIWGSVHRNPNKHIVRWIFVVLFGVLIVVGIKVSGSEFGSFLFERVTGRMDELSFSDAMEGSRTSQSQIVLKSWNNIILGEGMGSRGGAVRPLGLPGITDGNWVRWLVEYGVLGMLLFLIPVFMTVKKAFVKRKYFMVELTIIAYTLASMVVADSLSKGHMILMFWYAVGRIWNREYNQELIETDNHI